MPALSIIRQISDYPAAIALSLREIQDTLDYLQGQAGDVSYGDVVARVIRDLKVCLFLGDLYVVLTVLSYVRLLAIVLVSVSLLSPLIKIPSFDLIELFMMRFALATGMIVLSLSFLAISMKFTNSVVVRAQLGIPL